MFMRGLIQIGTILVFVGIIAIIIGIISSAGSSRQGKSNSKVLVGGFVGFIPFGFGNDKNIFWIGLILTIFLIIIMIVVNYHFLR